MHSVLLLLFLVQLRLPLHPLTPWLLPAHVLETWPPLSSGLWVLRFPLGPVVRTLCARVADGGEEIVRVVVAGDLGARRVDSSEHKRVEVGIATLESWLADGEVRGREEVEQGEVG